jgi:hypothetical protein
VPKRLFAILIGLDVLANSLIGGEPYQTISCRIGQSIKARGWAARFPWPEWLRRHFLSSVFKTIV